MFVNTPIAGSKDRRCGSMLGDDEPCAPKEIDENSAARSLRGGQAVTAESAYKEVGKGEKEWWQNQRQTSKI